MLINVMPTENVDVGFYRSKHVEIDQEVPEDAKCIRLDLPGHPQPKQVKVYATQEPNIVRVVNDSNYMVQLRVNNTFAVFQEVEEPEFIYWQAESDNKRVYEDDNVATFYASDVTLYDGIDALNLSVNIVELLEAEDIVSISDLQEATDAELLSIEGVGPATLAKIKEALAEYGSD